MSVILFDMDGILYDSEQFYLDGNYNQLKEMGFKGKKEELLAGVGQTVDGLFKLYARLLDDKYTIKEIREKNDKYYLEHPLNYKDLMFDGVYEMTKKLHEDGYKIACCSSSPISVIKESLKEMEIDSFFDYAVSSEEVDKPKPYPDVYLKAAEYFKEPVSNCIVYEDSDMGIRAGKNAGMFVIARYDDRFNQSQKDADILVKDIYEMVSFIEGNTLWKK